MEDGASPPPYIFSLVNFLALVVLLTFGLCPRAENRHLDIQFHNNHARIESIETFTRMMCVPKVFHISSREYAAAEAPRTPDPDLITVQHRRG